MAHLEKSVDKYHGNSQTTFTLNINLGKGLRNAFAGNYHNTEIFADCSKKRMRIRALPMQKLPDSFYATRHYS